MNFVLLQAVPSGITLEVPWLIATVTAVASALAGAIGITYRGQIKALTDENQFLRALLADSVGVQKQQTQNLDRAVTLAEVRAELRRGEKGA